MALTQYKINQLAKDLGIKTKEITDILKEKESKGHRRCSSL